MTMLLDATSLAGAFFAASLFTVRALLWDGEQS